MMLVEKVKLPSQAPGAGVCFLYICARFSHPSKKTTMYREFKSLHLPAIDAEIRQFWEDEKIFERSVEQRDPASTT
jgi:hypothetical protein